MQEKHKALQASLDAAKAETARMKDVEQALSQARKQLQEQEHRLKKVETETDTSSNARTEIISLQAKVSEVTQENELILIQLHQVQEELESYFLKYQKQVQGGQTDSVQGLIQAVACNSYQAAEIVYDLRREIDGDNWYYAEDDGRWAGPEEVSSIRVPALHGNEIEVELDVADAMDESILRGMEISVNGVFLRCRQDWDAYPAQVIAHIPREAIEGQELWEFRFMFSRLLSPAQLYRSDDHRQLAIRVRRLILRAFA